MSQRMIRINELLRLEISEQLHRRWRGESVRITISAVEISPDLHDAKIFYSVVGGPEDKSFAEKFLKRITKTLRMNVAKRVVLKYTPTYRFIEDKGMESGNDITSLLDKVASEDAARGPLRRGATVSPANEVCGRMTQTLARSGPNKVACDDKNP